MIKNPTKRKLIAELEKTGNVYIACLKSGISRATFYRWKNDNKEFRKRADGAVRQGRENNCDLAEHSLMIKVKEKNMEAIKYVLGHNSPRYKKPRTSNVIIDHRSNRPAPYQFNQTELDEENELIKKALELDGPDDEVSADK